MTMAALAQKAGTRSEYSDRLAIKDLIDAYSHNADRRKAHEQAMCFTEDAILEVYHHEPQPGARLSEPLILSNK